MAASATPNSPTRLERAVAAAVKLRASIPDVPAGVATLTDRVLPDLFPVPDIGASTGSPAVQSGSRTRRPVEPRSCATSYGALREVASGELLRSPGHTPDHRSAQRRREQPGRPEPGRERAGPISWLSISRIAFLERERAGLRQQRASRAWVSAQSGGSVDHQRARESAGGTLVLGNPNWGRSVLSSRGRGCRPQREIGSDPQPTDARSLRCWARGTITAGGGHAALGAGAATDSRAPSLSSEC